MIVITTGGIALAIPFAHETHRDVRPGGRIDEEHVNPLILLFVNDAPVKPGVDLVNVRAEREWRKFGARDEIHHAGLVALPIRDIQAILTRMNGQVGWV